MSAEDTIRGLMSQAAQAISGARLEMARSPLYAADRLHDAARLANEAAELLSAPEAAPAAEMPRAA